MGVGSLHRDALISAGIDCDTATLIGVRRTVAEIGGIVVGAAALFAATLDGRTPPWALVIAAGILGGAWLWSRKQRHDDGSFAAVVRSVVLLGAALWMFCSFRMAGWAVWPLARPADLEAYGGLFYMQFVLAATVGVAALWSVSRDAEHFIRWGQWRGSAVIWILVPCALFLWTISIWQVATHNILLEGTVFLFLTIAIAKAALLAFTEETAYRGVLLSVGAKRWGPGWAIICQALVFAVFHAFVVSTFTPRFVFVTAVFFLGLIFGWITWRTKGIGWAWLCHAAVALMVEWQNIS